jgi:enoyl-CoA hydratase
MSEARIMVETKDHVALLRLHRPHVLNALNQALVKRLADLLEELDREDGVRAIVLTGGDKAFAAGADIQELAGMDAVDFVNQPYFADWERIRRVAKPLIAAVKGYALGGGNELAMCCDMIIAGESAKFGQPEINIGVMPGAGGTQRLTKAIGKAKAMELILTGRMLTADEALAWGLVNRVVPDAQVEEEALALAGEIARKPPIAVRLAKQAVNRAQELTVEQGLQFEQHAFYLLFSSEDQQEGMKAFMEKRKPQFKGK